MFSLQAQAAVLTAVGMHVEAREPSSSLRFGAPPSPSPLLVDHPAVAAVTEGAGSPRAHRPARLQPF